MLWTDRQTDRAGCRVACTRLKTRKQNLVVVYVFVAVVFDVTIVVIVVLTSNILPVFFS